MKFLLKKFFDHVSQWVEQVTNTLIHPAASVKYRHHDEKSSLIEIFNRNDYEFELNHHTKSTTTTKINNSMCQIATTQSSEDNETKKMSPNDYSVATNNNHNHHLTDDRHLSTDIYSNTKCFVDLYRAALHLRQRMQTENLIHRSYAAYLNDENNVRSLFHNCFHSYETIEWLKKQQLCKSIKDGLEIFQVLEKLHIIHHVCDLNEFEYPSSGSPSSSTVKYLYRFRLDDATADQNRSFQQFASIFETYTSLFTLDKSQCRGVDLQQQLPISNPYDEQPGIAIKGDNLARMLALRSGATMQNVERLADDMIMYGLVRFDECDQANECDCCCTTRFHNDNHHQYLLSNSHRLLENKRLDLVALMQHDIFSYLPIHHSPSVRRNESSPFVSVSCPDRSSSICHFPRNISFNRTQSNYHCRDSLNKPSSNSCDHCHCSRVSSPSTETFVSSSAVHANRRRHQLSGPTSSQSSLLDDEQQSNRKISHGDEIECTTKLTCTVTTNDGFRRRKSTSLNSPANSENRPSADELEKLELPWRWKRFPLKRNRRGYGLILQGQGPCYVERLDPYGSAFTSGIRVNEYIYAIEGVNVLRRSGKEVERLLSMFDKCTIYTVYNREDYPQTATPPNELHANRSYSMKQPIAVSSPLNDYNNNATSNLLTTTTTITSDPSLNIQQKLSPFSSPPQHQQNSSPPSSIDAASSCSISPKPCLATSTTKKRTLSKPFSFFKLNSRSCSNPAATSTNTLK